MSTPNPSAEHQNTNILTVDGGDVFLRDFTSIHSNIQVRLDLKVLFKTWTIVVEGLRLGSFSFDI